MPSPTEPQDPLGLIVAACRPLLLPGQVNRTAEALRERWTLSPDQEAALRVLLGARLAGTRVLSLAGYAGSGKTTLMRAFVAGLGALADRTPMSLIDADDLVLAAPTGKAAARLHEVTGFPTTTIHSRLYGGPQSVPILVEGYGIRALAREQEMRETLANQGMVDPDNWTVDDWRVAPIGRKLKWLAVRLVDTTDPAAQELVKLSVEVAADATTVDGRRLIWTAPKPMVRAGGIVIIDESSMIDERLRRDLEGALPEGSTVFYVGDPGQLPPIDGPTAAPLDEPTARLTQIHRQAAGNPILALSAQIRQGAEYHRIWNTTMRPAADKVDLPFKQKDPAQILRTLVDRFDDERRKGTDQTVLVFTNANRMLLNKAIRERAGFPIDRLAVGERIVATRNKPELGMMNGELGVVEKVIEELEFPGYTYTSGKNGSESIYCPNVIAQYVQLKDMGSVIVVPALFAGDPMVLTAWCNKFLAPDNERFLAAVLGTGPDTHYPTTPDDAGLRKARVRIGLPGWPATVEDVKRFYKAALVKVHPDRNTSATGDSAEWVRVNKGAASAIREIQAAKNLLIAAITSVAQARAEAAAERAQHQEAARRHALFHTAAYYLPAAFGYALTTHRAQGSQWSLVRVLHEGMLWSLRHKDPDTARRWMYTAITRAQSRIIVYYP